MEVASEVGKRNEDQGEITVQSSVFKTEETGGCSDGSEEWESAWQLGDEAWVCDSGAGTRMTSSADCVLNYRDISHELRIANGSTRSIKG